MIDVGQTVAERRTDIADCTIDNYLLLQHKFIGWHLTLLLNKAPVFFIQIRKF